ncbi:TetR/AcrR family transcriptional regulator [Silvibacterium sp.]|uniref:TetR/AcrR family transcriptional regulator n=1 Tax=Silvibacterium sp. TaxID=1964179 RepID=UPI0039E238F3
MSTAKGGRPREFDPDFAAERAMEVFWARGYEGASMHELTAAMGINKPSLYAFFGDKRGLFDAAVEKYAEGPLSFGPKALALPTAKEAVAAALRGIIDVTTRRGFPKGCLQTHAALACSPENEEVREKMAARRQASEGRLRARLREGQKAGELPASCDVARLAKYFTTVANGITVQAASGASRKELEGVAEVALAAWPK